MTWRTAAVPRSASTTVPPLLLKSKKAACRSCPAKAEANCCTASGSSAPAGQKGKKERKTETNEQYGL
jgi:positive regulator of sigma E activity